MSKKWLCILIAFGLTVPAFSQDDEYYEEEYYEEEAAPKRPSKRAAKKEAEEESSGSGRFGLKFGFGSVVGNPAIFTPNVGFVYDMGNGILLGLNLGLDRWSYTSEIEGFTNPDPTMDITLTPNFKYQIGKSLLGYGAGLDVSVMIKTDGTDFSFFPNFFVGTELVPNVGLSLATGLNIASIKNYEMNEEGKNVFVGTDLNMGLRTNLALVFYFM